MSTPRPAPKTCRTCGRRIEWRRRWERSWDDVRVCSKRCRRRLDATDEALEREILAILAERAGGATICPSEAARAVAPTEWRELTERAREAARRLVARGRLEILQKGKAVDPSTAKGPIRLRATRG
jgi:hypothetical protein